MRRAPVIPLIGLLTAGVVVAGCARPKRKPPNLDPARLAAQVDQPMTRSELHARLNEYAYRYIGATEYWAGRIVRDTDDPNVRHRAIIWTLRANEEVVRAGLYRYPVAMLIDLWALAVQMDEFVRSEHAYHGPYAEQVRAVTAELRRDIEAIAMEFGDEKITNQGRMVVERWAEVHPMTGEFSRVSTSELVASLLPGGDAGLLGSFDDMSESITDVANRLDILNSQLPRQLIWRAALLTDEYFGETPPDVLLAKLDATLDLAVDLPETITAEREAVMTDIDRQRTETLAEIDRQRELILGDIDRQRVETLETIETLTRESFAVVDTQRAAIDASIIRTVDELVEDIDAQRVATLDDLERVMDRTIATTDDATKLVDHIFRRAVQLAAVIFVAALISVIVYARVRR